MSSFSANQIKFLNRNFLFVYQPNPELFIVMPAWYCQNIKSDRFLIGAGQLPKYLGQINAETVQKSALNQQTDKHTIKFRKYGKIIIYVK